MNKRVAVFLLVAFLSVLGLAHPASADDPTYAYYLCDIGHTSHWVDYTGDPDGSNPFPLRWWHEAPYSTNATWYKLGSTLTTTFKSAARSSEAAWESAVWGGGTQYFHFYEDTTPITDPQNRTLGMAELGWDVVGAMFLLYDSWHPMAYHSLPDIFGHSFGQWYIRFQSNLTGKVDPDFYWGSDDVQNCMDRQSVATHEMGHVIGLMHPFAMVRADWQTMAEWQYEERTGTYQRTPSAADVAGVQHLYPGY